jgi:hypothetical protein
MPFRSSIGGLDLSVRGGQNGKYWARLIGGDNTIAKNKAICSFYFARGPDP